MKQSNNRVEMVCKICGCHFTVRPDWKYHKGGSATFAGCKACSAYNRCRTTKYTKCDWIHTIISCPLCDNTVEINKYPNDPKRVAWITTKEEGDYDED